MAALHLQYRPIRDSRFYTGVFDTAMSSKFALFGGARRQELFLGEAERKTVSYTTREAYGVASPPPAPHWEELPRLRRCSPRLRRWLCVHYLRVLPRPPLQGGGPLQARAVRARGVRFPCVRAGAACVVMCMHGGVL